MLTQCSAAADRPHLQEPGDELAGQGQGAALRQRSVADRVPQVRLPCAVSPFSACGSADEWRDSCRKFMAKFIKAGRSLSIRGNLADVSLAVAVNLALCCTFYCIIGYTNCLGTLSVQLRPTSSGRRNKPHSLTHSALRSDPPLHMSSNTGHISIRGNT